MTIHILHTNDFHNHLSNRKAEAITRLRRDLSPDLILDSGDAISAGNVGVRPGGEPILTLMSSLGYDAMTLGNREFHVSDSLLRHKIGKARFPVLCANIRWKDDRQEALPVVENMRKQAPNGPTIAVFGLTVPMVTRRMGARVLSSFLFDDPVDEARRQIEKLRPQCDVLIALTHIGLRQDERLAAACPELDLVIGGHSHSVLSEPIVCGGVPIVQAGWYGHYAGFVALELAAGEKPSVTARLIAFEDLEKKKCPS